MFKLAVFVCCLAATYSQTSVPLSVICGYIKQTNCAFFAHHQECGSNGVTYANRCEFSKHHCDDTSVFVVHPGPCQSTSGTTGSGHKAVYQFFCDHMKTSDCGSDVEHLCGSDGKDYNNFCLFEKARCTNQAIYVAKYTTCSK